MTNPLELKIIKRNQIECVFARELHEKLKIETPFRKWFPRMISYGFTENVDYKCCRSKMSATKNQHTDETKEVEVNDFAISIDMAKEICMIQRSDIGRQYRQYFIELEKRFKEQKTLEYKEERKKSIETRKTFTDELKRRGYTERNEYCQTTIQMKDVLGIACKKGKMTVEELKAVKASEALSSYLLTDEYGFKEVNPICITASGIVKNAKRKILQLRIF